MVQMRSSNPASAPTFERTTLHTPHELTPLQADILLLCAKPRTIRYLLNVLQVLQPEPDRPADIWLAITQLRKHGLIAMLLPKPAIPFVHLPTIPNYQKGRLVA